ncbi:hypothetical protein [Pelagibacterium sp. WS-203]|uniref:hypothetical protein n=1 Tax=Pelagibacterium TaxID=1082930 RepID=UPI002FCAA283
MFSGDNTDFVLAMNMATRAKNAETARRRAAAGQARLSSALSALQRRVAELEQELARERGLRLQLELVAKRRRLFS